MGRRDRHELESRLTVLVSHLLKWQLQPDHLIVDLLKWRSEPGARCGNWRSAILQQRFEIERIIEDSPSLREFATGRLGEAYSDARERVVEALGLLQPDFPSDCPFTLDQVLSHSFVPED